jgi:predicted transcriptional regulator
MKREEIEKLLANHFVDHFFSGSTSRLVASLFGSKRISEADVQQIRQLLDELQPDSQTDQDRSEKPDK